MVTMVCVVSRFRLKAPSGTSSPYISHPSHHRDKVTAPHGRPNLRSRLHFRHSQEGVHEVRMNMWWHKEKKLSTFVCLSDENEM